MTGKRIQKIAAEIVSGTIVTVRIAGHLYDVEYDYSNDWVTLVARGTGSDACSATSDESYAYTHGGGIYRAALETAWDILAAVKEGRNE